METHTHTSFNDFSIEAGILLRNGDTYIYNGNLYLSGDIHKGLFSVSTGAWTEQKKLNDYFVMKGVKSLHCLDINNSTELLELHYDD